MSSDQGSQESRLNSPVRSLSRRRVWQGAAALAPITLIPASAEARTPNRRAILRVVQAQKDETVALIQDWIRNPSIAAENLKMQEGAEYMARLARDYAERADLGRTTPPVAPRANTVTVRPREIRGTDELTLLRAICKEQHDSACLDRLQQGR